MALRRLIAAFRKWFCSNKKKQDFVFSNEMDLNKNISIGDYTYGSPEVYFVEQAKLEIGKFCSIAWDVKIFLGGNHRSDWLTTYPFNSIPRFHNCDNIKGHPSTNGNVTIKNDVWIGTGALILSGVTIGNGAIIGANSVVSRNVGDYEIWAGNPARFIRKRFENEVIDKLQEIAWWEWPIEKIMENVGKLCSENINDFLMDQKIIN